MSASSAQDRSTPKVRHLCYRAPGPPNSNIQHTSTIVWKLAVRLCGTCRIVPREKRPRRAAVHQSARLARNARWQFQAIAPAICRHSSAQRSQASAQRWQCSVSCRRHSWPQASQMSAQMRQISVAKRESRDMYAAAMKQMAEQSRSRRMHSAIAETSCSSRQAVAQCSHSCAHSRHARMQDSCCWCAMTGLLESLSCSPAQILATAEPARYGGIHETEAWKRPTAAVRARHEVPP